MSFLRQGVPLNVGVLWAATWGLWLLTGAALPLPPWKADAILAGEEAAAARAALPERAPVWSMDVGGPLQARALGPGFSDHEAFLDAGRRVSFAWIEAPARVAFASPDWPEAHLSLRVFPLPQLAPLAVAIDLDGEPRGELLVPGGWSVVHLPIGAVSAGRHVLGLTPRAFASPGGEPRRLSLALDGIAVGQMPVEDPARDRGVFAGTIRLGLDDRPAVFVSEDATATIPPDAARLTVAPGLAAWVGFGIGPAAGPLAAPLALIHGLATALLLVLVPGLVWSGLLRARGLARLSLALGLSVLALVAVFAILRWTGLGPAPIPLALGLAALSGAPLPWMKGRGRIELPWLAAVPGLLGLVVLAFFATRVVPPLEDQDMETQGTAWGLATHLAPEMLTNRGTTFFFAHPPLLHLWQAGSFALGGRLGRVAAYAEAARAARVQGEIEPPPGAPLGARAHYVEWKGLLRRFLGEPLLWPTRQVNVLLGSLALGLLAWLAASLSLSRTAGIALALVLASFPEFLVRGSYGGYFSAGAVLSLLALDALGKPAPSALASGLAALADQKGLLVPVAWLLAAPRGSARARLAPLAGGLLALALFATWGLMLDSPAFRYEFAREHVLRRLDLSDVRFVPDAARFYPSIPDLWREFAARYGLLFTLWGGLASLHGLRARRPLARAAGAAVLLGALVFSLTDWRQAKHLSMLAAPALLAIAAAWPPQGRLRRVALLAVALLVLHNLRTAWPLLTSFESLRPAAGW